MYWIRKGPEEVKGLGWNLLHFPYTGSIFDVLVVHSSGNPWKWMMQYWSPPPSWRKTKENPRDHLVSIQRQSLYSIYSPDAIHGLPSLITNPIKRGNVTETSPPPLNKRRSFCYWVFFFLVRIPSAALTVTCIYVLSTKRSRKKRKNIIGISFLSILCRSI